jgi:murein DD-endopeptidase MepM/ murein hydrolase activator NlpD
VKRLLLVIPLVIIVGALVLLLLLSATPKVDLDPALSAIGTSTPVKIRITAPHGVRHISAWVEQNGSRYQVYDQARPSTRLLFFKRQKPEDVTFEAGTKNAPSLKDGKARLIVEATSNDLRGSAAEEGRDINVITRPPSVAADGAQHYINQGGAELVTFSVQGFWTEAGEKSGSYTFRSFAVPGKAGQRFSLFVYPWDLPPDTAPFVYARNPAGNEAVGHFWFKVFPKKFRKRDLPLDDAFLNKVVSEIDPNGSGDILTRFLKINGEMRRENNKTLSDLRNKTEERILWSGPFLRMNAKWESAFADDRTYMYKGKKVDEQVHLGFDLSNVKNTPIPAANDGKVVWAERLGIYGNCIVVDHGFGLQSIYGHLNEIKVKPGDMVKKGQIMGLSGATGLAGGDHLHFSMQIDGVQTNPVEWWDEHWIHDRILSKLGPQ